MRRRLSMVACAIGVLASSLAAASGCGRAAPPEYTGAVDDSVIEFLDRQHEWSIETDARGVLADAFGSIDYSTHPPSVLAYTQEDIDAWRDHHGDSEPPLANPTYADVEAALAHLAPLSDLLGDALRSIIEAGGAPDAVMLELAIGDGFGHPGREHTRWLLTDFKDALHHGDRERAVRRLRTLLDLSTVHLHGTWAAARHVRSGLVDGGADGDRRSAGLAGFGVFQAFVSAFDTAIEALEPMIVGADVPELEGALDAFERALDDVRPAFENAQDVVRASLTDQDAAIARVRALLDDRRAEP